MTTLARVHAVLGGERVPLDDGATKVLSFMLREPLGCDAWITDQLVVQLGPHSANHRYRPELAPTIVSWLLDHAPARHLPAGTMPYWGGAPKRWSYGPSNVWIAPDVERVMIMIRDASDPADRAPLPLPPPPIEAPPQFAIGDRACPHCAVIPERYRVLRDGGLVCLTCGASSRG